MATRSTRRSARLSTSLESNQESTDSKEAHHAIKVKEEVPDTCSSDAAPTIQIKQEPGIEPANTDSSSANSLAFLADVAQSRRVSNTAPPPTKVPKLMKHGQQVKKTSGSRHGMTLDEIWGLTDKQLVQMFSELTSNELTRNFAYTCYLMPESCAEIFTSFGNENKAKSDMQYHLLAHLRALLNQAKADPNFVFTAQTVQSRRKQGLDKSGNKKKKLKENLTGKKSSVDKSSASSAVDNDNHSHKMTLTTAGANASQLAEDKDDKMSNNEMFVTSSGRRGRRVSKGDTMSRFLSKRQESKPDTLPSIQVKVEQDDAFLENTATIPQSDSFNESSLLGNSKPSRDKATLEMFKKQPYVDHSYLAFCFQKEKRDDSRETVTDLGTSRTSGWKYGMNEEMDEDDKQVLSVVIRVQNGMMPAPNKLYIPIVRVPKSMAFRTESDLGNNTQVTETNNLSATNASLGMNNSPLESDSDEDDDDDYEEVTTATVRQRKRFEIADRTSDLHRKLALKYIHELRSKKKEDMSLICKICKNKTFTAPATLHYHYRSHAGIKPFICMICNTTFTRQHSLNYHMLIHKNQNRFTCKDCGRMFRHPSHFKEHQRRHTGETPYSCSDCQQRFKTRNTYKRHLRTRHGKLLMASGIQIMPRDEFLRVRTKPYLHERLDDVEIDKASSEDDLELSEELIRKQRMKEMLPPPPLPPTTGRKPAILSHSSLSNRNNTADTFSV